MGVNLATGVLIDMIGFYPVWIWNLLLQISALVLYLYEQQNFKRFSYSIGFFYASNIMGVILILSSVCCNWGKKIGCRIQVLMNCALFMGPAISCGYDFTSKNLATSKIFV